MRAYWDRAISSWDLNPVVVKELRQAVRSYLVSGVLLLFLFALLVFMLVFMASNSTAPTFNLGIGGQAFYILSGILAAASLLFVPVYTGVRIALERQEGNVDLLYTTTLTPGRIIRGKLLSGLYLAILFGSACMPFILLTIFLRGVDLLTIAITFYYLFGMTLLAVQAAILLACLPISHLFKVLVSAPAVTGMVSLVSVFMSIVQSWAQGSAIPSASVLFYSTLSVLLAWGWLYVCSVGLISPKPMNRALPIRLYTLLVWLSSGLFSAYFSTKLISTDPLKIWMGFTMVLLVLVLLFSVGEPDRLSWRVLARIPQRAWWRLPVFPFFNGAAQGVAWCLLVTLVSSPVLCGLSIAGWSTPLSPSETDYTWASILFYAYSYCLTGLFFHRQFFSDRTPILASVIAVLVPLLFATIPALVLFFINRLNWQVMEGLQLGNILNLAFTKDPGSLAAHFYFALAWAALAGLVNIPWFLRQARAFRPPGPSLLEAGRQQA